MISFLCLSYPLYVPAYLGIMVKQLEPEGRRLRMDLVGTPAGVILYSTALRPRAVWSFRYLRTTSILERKRDEAVSMTSLLVSPRWT